MSGHIPFWLATNMGRPDYRRDDYMGHDSVGFVLIVIMMSIQNIILIFPGEISIINHVMYDHDDDPGHNSEVRSKGIKINLITFTFSKAPQHWRRKKSPVFSYPSTL